MFPFTVLAGRILDAVITSNERRKASVFFFHPAKYIEARLTVRTQCRLELAERFLMGGQFCDAPELATSPTPLTEEIAARSEEELLFAKWDDPIAGFLDAYLILQAVESGRLESMALKRKQDLLQIARSNLVNNFGETSDSHVISASVSLLSDDTLGAAASITQALDRGIPLFAMGLLRLQRAIGQCVGST